MEEEIKLCKYGCGQEAKYTLKNGDPICCKNWMSCPINRKKFKVPLLSAVMGTLIDPSQFLLIPLKAIN